jgi:GTP cyclohydrolase I
VEPNQAKIEGLLRTARSSTAHIGYIPNGKVFGVSKLISQVVRDEAHARGVGVMIEARHLCMMMRGVEKQNSTMVTLSVLGVFRENLAKREEFLGFVRRRDP